MSKSLKNGALLFLTVLTAGFTNPTARIKIQIAEFKSKFPDHIQSYQIGDRSMQYAWSGDVHKQPVIWVHGSPGSWDSWSEFLLDPDLQQRFHLIAVDRPGYGGSGEGLTEPSLAEQAKDIAAVLQFNKSGEKAILIGHSFGGAVIAQMAVDQAEQVAALIFVASSVDPSQEATTWYQYTATWWPFRALVPTALQVCNAEIMALKDQLKELAPRWAQIKASVVSIQGGADNLVPAANQDFIKAHVADAQLKWVKRVDDMNHFVPWEHPELILEGLNRVSQKP